MVRVGAGLVLAAAIVIAGASLWPRAPEVLAVVPCDFAVMVDGALHCDDEAPRDVAGLCGAGMGEFAHGDAIEREALCAVAQAGEARRDGPGWRRMGGEDLEALKVPVDLNRASAEELESLPGIGPELARRIVEGRPYASVEELLRVHGIGPKRLAAVRSRARVEATGR